MRPAPYVALLAVVGLGCAQVTGLDELDGEPASSPGGSANGAADAGGAVIGVGDGTRGERGDRPDDGAGGGPSTGGSSTDGSSTDGSVGSSSGGAGSSNGSPGSSNGGAGGNAAGSAGLGGAGGANGGSAGSGGSPPSAGESTELGCGSPADCGPAAVCTPFLCEAGACVASVAAPGSPCGSLTDDACTNPDSCDGQGVCQANDEPLGTGCPGGTCIGAQCIAAPASGCSVDVVTSVPTTAAWSSVNRPDLFDGGCDAEGTPDYALVFIAPEAGTYRIAAAALVDSVPYTGAGDASGVPDPPPDGDCVMTIAEGDCAGPEARQIGCNDDVATGNVASQLDVELEAQQVITVYLNELTQTGGGTGSLSISLLP